MCVSMTTQDALTALRPMHLDHGLLNGVEVITLDGSDTLDRGDVATICRQDGHQTGIHRVVLECTVTVHLG